MDLNPLMETVTSKRDEESGFADKSDKITNIMKRRSSNNVQKIIMLFPHSQKNLY